MNKRSLLGATALHTFAAAGLAMAFTGTAFAQQAQNNQQETAADEQTPPTEQNAAEAPSQASTAGDQEILVTGSRIRRPNLDSPVPVTSVTAEELLSQGDVNVGDALNDLPAIRSTYSQANSTRFIGTAGINLLDLRGLGISRTLVLVNGRRHVTAQVGEFLVDTNTIPTDLIERVDVITGGSSAVYGSDAVAGVINFILKNNYEGLTVRGQGGISSRGDRGIYTASITAGKNLLDDRLNIAGNLEYVQANPLYFRDRDGQSGAFSGRCQFNLSEVTTGESPFGSDGIPDQTFFCGVRNNAISDGGTLTAIAPALTGGCTNATLAPGGANAALGAARCLNQGTGPGQPRVFRFAPNGDLLQDVILQDFRPFGSGNVISDPNSPVPGTTLRRTGQFAPGLKRYTGNILMSMEITPAFQPFFEGKFVRVDALQEGQPSFFQGGFGAFFGGGNGIRCDNAFITAQNLAALQSIGRCTGGRVFSETLPVGRFNVDFGGRSEKIRRDTYRLVGGIRGDFNEDWNYEIAVNYGRVKLNQTQRNNLITFDLNGNPDGFLLASDAVFNAAGQIVCRVNQTTVVRPDCVPINVFGDGRPDQAALDFIQTDDTFVKGRASQFNVVGYVGGDLSQLFELPGGPIRFVLGGEYRREKARYRADPLSESGGTFFNAFAPFNPPTFSVKEAFGEIEFPILKDLPFAHELTVSAAGRYSDYNTSAGTTKAYNINGVYAPVRDIRFRANYSKSVRVPTLGDLFSPATQNFAFLGDPCDVLNINNGTSERPINCAADGVPVGFANLPARSQTTEIVSSGNPFLTPEKGKSFTAGFIFQPSFVPGLNVSVDYYRIRVSNLIAVLGGQTILNQCYDLPRPNQFCSLIFPRNPDSTFAQPALISGGINFAKQKADGIDFEVGYRRTFGDIRTDSRLLATYVLKRENYTDPLNPAIADQVLFELGDPQFTANFSTTLTYKNFDLRYGLQYIGKQTIGAYENYFEFQGRPPVNADSTAEVWYPEKFIHNIRLNWRVDKKYSFYAGVDNVTDELPPLGLIGNEGGNPFDPIGRYFYAGFRADF